MLGSQPGLGKKELARTVCGSQSKSYLVLSSGLARCPFFDHEQALSSNTT